MDRALARLRSREALQKRAAEQRRAENEQRERHRAELESLHGVSGNPKAERLYEIAWNLGHSAGFSEVALHYAKMVGLIQ